MDKSLIISSLQKIFLEVQSTDGWIDFALLGKPLRSAGINYKALGYLKLTDFIDEFSDLIEVKSDTSHQVPVKYARFYDYVSDDKNTVIDKSVTKRKAKPTRRNRDLHKLQDWAFIYDYPNVINNLKKLAIPERWHFRKQNPSFPYPILSSYLTYTFYRLSRQENKILYSGKYACFNTGLVDNLYEPIYALFEENKRDDVHPYVFKDFCIAGIDRLGKEITRNFNPLPERAHYFSDPSELIYNVKAPEPQLNWNHIILDNVDRLPIDFLQDHKPNGFVFKNTSNLNTIDRDNYYRDLASTIENDTRTFRSIKNRFNDALHLALKRVEWNYKTAIPMYYPREDRMSLLLPLCLIEEDTIDLALVLERTQSGNYLGHTILPLAWAYGNARLVTRPDSDWLNADDIETDSDEDDE